MEIKDIRHKCAEIQAMYPDDRPVTTVWSHFRGVLLFITYGQKGQIGSHGMKCVEAAYMPHKSKILTYISPRKETV